MFGSEKRKRLQTAVRLIIDAGQSTSQWYQHEESLQWNQAQLWVTFCGTISTFASLIAIESISAPQDKRNREFFKSLEDALFAIYNEYSKLHMVSLRACIPLESERVVVRNTFNISDNTQMRMDTILGVIFPIRLQVYQKDLIQGYASERIHAPYDYLAMRLAAHLTGIETPVSLVGHTAHELGIMSYGSALTPLFEFGSAYINQRG